ncbi:hypothetical protein L6164_022244 [Bauhinia variegata]|uniref:Uncharacterized protein n=1 Tax=Bauhinia variegata TaxID=167791 RepID=A0ACB9MGD1_BAUVA|nr:hypothetical protein L6164_022244 [Bauhinia variegata]
MDPLCEFCDVARAVVCCKRDSARLCLYCDGCVHSANALSRRHPRSLLCDKCNFQPATVRCMDDKMSLCQGCDWNHACSALGHRHQTLTCYTDCPTLSELCGIWSSVLDTTTLSGFDNAWGSVNTLPKSDSCSTKSLQEPGNDGSFGLVTGKLNDIIESSAKYEPWMGQSPLIPPNPSYMPYCRDQPLLLPQESSLPKMQECPNFKDLEGLGLNIDDVQLNFDSSDEIFGCSQGANRCQLEDGGMDCLLTEKNLSVTESNVLPENAVEASSSVQQERVPFQSSTAGGNINLGFTQGQVHSSISLSLSNITGESSATDYQDSGLSPVFLTGDTPWESNLEPTYPQARDKAKMRYNEKKNTRTFGKQIRYASRKAPADTRKRVKGRFVKAGEAYDYDPLVTRNY